MPAAGSSSVPCRLDGRVGPTVSSVSYSVNSRKKDPDAGKRTMTAHRARWSQHMLIEWSVFSLALEDDVTRNKVPLRIVGL